MKSELRPDSTLTCTNYERNTLDLQMIIINNICPFLEKAETVNHLIAREELLNEFLFKINQALESGCQPVINIDQLKELLNKLQTNDPQVAVCGT